MIKWHDCEGRWLEGKLPVIDTVNVKILELVTEVIYLGSMFSRDGIYEMDVVGVVVGKYLILSSKVVGNY